MGKPLLLVYQQKEEDQLAVNPKIITGVTDG